MAEIWHGNSSWSEQSWVGPFYLKGYPKGTAPRDILNHYYAGHGPATIRDLLAQIESRRGKSSS